MYSYIGIISKSSSTSSRIFTAESSRSLKLSSKARIKRSRAVDSGSEPDLRGLLLKLIGTTPDQYAVFPVYILAAPEAQKTMGSAKYFGRVLQPAELGAWAKIPKNREALWGKLLEIIGKT